MTWAGRAGGGHLVWGRVHGEIPSFPENGRVIGGGMQGHDENQRQKRWKQ